MMTLADVSRLQAALADRGFAEDVEWSESVQPPASAEQFAIDIIFVICNSGMNNVVARKVFERVRDGALYAGLPAGTQFGHRGKTAAIDHVWSNRARLFAEYRASDDKLAFIGNLPWIGEITK